MVPTSCNVCQGDLGARFGAVSDPQTGEVFSILACRVCGLGHTSPQPDDLGRYYGPEYHGRRHGLTARYCILRRRRLVRKIAGAAQGRRLLDVGCGDGSFLDSLRGVGWKVAGTEMNAAEARSRGIEVHQSLDDLAGAGPFGCITLWHSLEHLRDPRGALVALARMLAPGGVLVAAVPDAGGLQAKAFGARWFHLDVPRHLYHFDRATLRRALEAAGLQVGSEWHQEFEYDLFGWSQSALNTVMPSPNVFFRQLTGKSVPAGTLERGANLLLGAALTTLAVPAVPVASMLARGGTLVMSARRPEQGV
jgi:SAM-dependent methyltransferase